MQLQTWGMHSFVNPAAGLIIWGSGSVSGLMLAQQFDSLYLYQSLQTQTFYMQQTAWQKLF